jgi:hypothetical protein
MSEIQKYSEALDSTLKSDALLDVNAGIAETLLDGVMNEGIAKDLPIIGSFIGLAKTGIQIKDYLFLKKIISFLTELHDIPTDKRQKMISEIDESGEYRISVGQKLLYIIDKCEDHEKAEISAILFKAFLKKEIGYDEFLKVNRVVESSTVDDIKRIAQGERDKLGIEDAAEMLTSGLYVIEPMSVQIEKDQIHLSSTFYNEPDTEKPDFKIKGGELRTTISPSGLIIRKCLKPKYGNLQ